MFGYFEYNFSYKQHLKLQVVSNRWYGLFIFQQFKSLFVFKRGRFCWLCLRKRSFCPDRSKDRLSLTEERSLSLLKRKRTPYAQKIGFNKGKCNFLPQNKERILYFLLGYKPYVPNAMYRTHLWKRGNKKNSAVIIVERNTLISNSQEFLCLVSCIVTFPNQRYSFITREKLVFQENWWFSKEFISNWKCFSGQTV